MFIEAIRERVRGLGRRVAFPEAQEERTLRAAGLLRDQKLAVPVLLGASSAVRERAAALGVNLEGIELRDPDHDPKASEHAKTYFDLRKHKGVTPEGAADRIRAPHYFGALLVKSGEADGMVSGLNSETKPFLPAFEIVKLAEGYSRASSLFVMDWPDRTLFYSDCGVNIAPDAATLAEIGRATAASVRAFGIEPRVAFLSFSTRDSAKDASIDRVKEAVALVRKTSPSLVVDGEIQFDAAFVPAVARKKAPDSPFVDAPANVFVFPDINAGNIAYKITERLGGAIAMGPILQGLRKPVNDVSRGCSAEDLADVAVVTAAMAGLA
jgi:phosphate acetyltransferase